MRRESEQMSIDNKKNIKNNMEAAREFLKNSIREKTNLYNFRIDSEEELSHSVYEFKVFYNWRLNAWEKSVNTSIVLVYSQKDQTFICSMPLVN